MPTTGVIGRFWNASGTAVVVHPRAACFDWLRSGVGRCPAHAGPSIRGSTTLNPPKREPVSLNGFQRYREIYPGVPEARLIFGEDRQTIVRWKIGINGRIQGTMQSVAMMDDSMKIETSPESPEQPERRPAAWSRGRGKAGPAAMALVIGLAALTAQASESDLVRDIQRYCTVCWRNARLDPMLWDDCTQEVCCRLLDQGARRRTRTGAGARRRHSRAPRTGPGNRHGPQTRAAHQAASSRSTTHPLPAPISISEIVTGSSSARSWSPPGERFFHLARIASSSSGCAAGPFPRSGLNWRCR